MKIPLRDAKRYGCIGLALILSVLLAVPNGVALQPSQVSTKNLQAFTNSLMKNPSVWTASSDRKGEGHTV